IDQHWPSFMPGLLTLATDTSKEIRRRGLQILTQFISKFPNKTLRDRGLSKVFEDAVFPTLSYLPTLTPESESVLLLDLAFDALISLAGKQKQQPSPATGISEQKKALDKILREGVFPAYAHAKSHMLLVRVLCLKLGSIVSMMGVHAVKYLQDIIPILLEVIAEDFAPLVPETLSVALDVLDAVLTNCWPMIPGIPWQDKIIAALVICWENVVREHDNDSGNEDFIQIKQKLVHSARGLEAVLKTAGISLAIVVSPMVANPADARQLYAAGLFSFLFNAPPPLG
ncbi:hypothetical protein B0T17DRAFT_498777, partial [Bombardia bombarda]